MKNNRLPWFLEFIGDLDHLHKELNHNFNKEKVRRKLNGDLEVVSGLKDTNVSSHGCT